MYQYMKALLGLKEDEFIADDFELVETEENLEEEE